MSQLDANGNPIVTTNDKSGNGSSSDNGQNNNNGNPNDKGGDGSSSDKDNAMVPSARLKEEADKRRELEAKLAEHEKEKAERLEAEKKAKEAEALKKGEHEKVIQSKDEELKSYKSKDEERKQKTEKIKTLSDAKVEEFKTKYGEEALKNAMVLINSDDPWVILEKIDSVAGLLGNLKPVGGSKDMPGSSGGEKNLQYFQTKLDKGETLSIPEAREYSKLLEKLEEK